MNNTQCCVIDADNYYVDLFSVYEDGEKVLHVYGYTMQPGDRMLDVSQPLKRLHVGGEGFVRPRWDASATAWVEGATAEELVAWEAEHPAPPAPPPSRVDELEVEVARLKAQNELQAQHQTFLEDCLLEMGNIVYA